MTLLRLELRKNALAAASLAAAFAVTLALTPLVAALSGLEASRAFEALFTLWRFLGAPLGATLLGAACGAKLAEAGTRASESPLPVSPARRFATAALAPVLLFTALSFPLFLTIGWQPAPMIASFRPNLQLAAGQTAVWSPLLLACFAAAYVTRSGVAGGLLGGTIFAAVLYPVGAVMMEIEREEGPVSYAWLLASMLAVCAGPLYAAWRSFRRRERALERAGEGFRLAALLLSGPALTWLLLGRMLYIIFFDPSSLHTE